MEVRRDNRHATATTGPIGESLGAQTRTASSRDEIMESMKRVADMLNACLT